MKGVRHVALPLLLATGCADSDGDGLTDRREGRLGTDAALADTDADGLSDGEEVLTHGTSALLPDTDQDGYLDGDEVHAGTDPNNLSDVIYQGGWPYNRSREDLALVGFDSPPQQFARFPSIEMPDQFGDLLSLHDFADHGKHILIEVCIAEHQGCGQWSAWRAQLDNWQELGDFDRYEGARVKVNRGDAYWILILVATGNWYEPGPVSPSTPVTWFEHYPHAKVPVVADVDDQIRPWLARAEVVYPFYLWLNPDLTIRRMDRETDPSPAYTLELFAAHEYTPPPTDSGPFPIP